jgi:hypothetical protein
MNVAPTLDAACMAQFELIRRMREVRATLPTWSNLKTIEAAWAADPACSRLLSEADQAFESLYPRRPAPPTGGVS